MMKKKHAIKYAKLLQKYEEEGKQRDLESEDESNAEEAKDQGLKTKIEGILIFMKEMNRGHKEKEEVKA